MAAIEPDRIRTSQDLAEQLALLFDRDPRGVQRFATEAGLGAGTVQALITGRTAIPRVGTLESFVRACGHDPRPWLAARARLFETVRLARLEAKEAPGQGSPTREASGTAVAPIRGAVRVSDVDWRALSVHAPIRAAAADPDTLPVYVPRDIDEQPGGLRPWLRAAARTGGMLVLVGGSSVGKSRCLLEAITTVLPDWWLLRPDGSDELARLAADPPARLVLWVDELQQHLGDGGLTAAVAGRLISAGSVLVGTLWPFYYQMYSAPPSGGVGFGQFTDLYGREREALKHARILRLPELPSNDELERAHTLAEPSQGASGGCIAGDDRLREALRHPEYGFTQIIAAAPQLADCWDDAGPYARAVLAAAVDAVRLGVHATLPGRLLHQAAPGYCTPVERAQAPPDWFEQAQAYTTRTLLGATAALVPVAGDMSMGVTTGYRVADYLLQHALPQRRLACPPGTFWKACVAHLADPADIARLGIASLDRLRIRDAIPLLSHAAPNHWYAAVRLAYLKADMGEVGQAIDLLRPHSEAEVVAASLLVKLLAEGENIEELGVLADAGDSEAARRLAELLAKRGEEEPLRARADAGDSYAARELVELLVRRGDVEALRARADAGDLYAAKFMAGAFARLGELERAIALLLPHADSDYQAAERLAALLVEQGDVDQLRARADAGDWHAARQLGGVGEAEKFVIQSMLAHSGDNEAERLAALLVEQGDVDQLRARADAGDTAAAFHLVELLVKHGNIEELSTRTDAGDVYAGMRLWAALRAQGRDEEADRLARFGLTAEGDIASGL